MVPEVGDLWEYTAIAPYNGYTVTHLFLVLSYIDDEKRYTVLRLKDGNIIKVKMENNNIGYAIKTEWKRII